MQETRSIAVCGATGVVGSECLRLLLADPTFARVVVLTRRPLPADLADAAGAAKLQVHIVDFDNLEVHAALLHVNQVLCALGTTIKQAGSQERFRQVDYGYPLALARLGARQGAQHFLLVSALGANAHSRIFYNRVKGELEEAVSALPYRSTTIARPSLLLGERREFRLGEEVAKRLAPLIPSKYKPIAASAVAAGLVRAAKEDRPGHRLLESTQLHALATTRQA